MARDVVLLIDDEPDLIELVSYNLIEAGFDVVAEKDGRAGLEAARRRPPDLIILDIMLPGMDGLEVCRELRNDSRAAMVPIIMLTARGAETDRVVGLELGADDYVVKPFSPRELVARVKAVLRRGHVHSEAKDIIRHGELCIDMVRHKIMYGDDEVHLTVAEFAILRYLAGHPERVLSRNEIIDGALGKEVVVTDRNVDVHIGAIRRKLGAGRAMVETIRGIGYRFVPQGGG